MTYLHRAYSISSSYLSLHSEFEFLNNLFTSHNYPPNIVSQYIFKFLSKIYHPPFPVSTVPKKTIYFSVPYLNHSTISMTSKLSRTLSHFFPHLDIRFSFRSSFKISTLFPYKSSLPFPLKSSVVYKFTCPSCQKGYIGSTVRLLRTRISEHQGLSPRTSLPLSNPSFSNIRSHSQTSCHFFPLPQHFSVLDSNQDVSSLHILESLYISKLKPGLNNNQLSCPLYISHT